MNTDHKKSHARRFRTRTSVEGQKEPAGSPSLADLFLSFLRLGVAAFGGPAMTAYVRDLAVARKKWIDQETFEGGVALAQSIPGATAMQTVAYVGLQARGVSGALVSYIGFGLPTFLLMLGFSVLYGISRNIHWVTSIFSGLQVIVVAIIANATFSFGRSSLKHPMHFVLAAASTLGLGLAVSPFYVILGAAFFGALLMRGSAEKQPAEARGKTRDIRPVLILSAILGLGLIFLSLLHPGLFSLAVLMLKIDLFAFGGGYASIPLMLQEIVYSRGWMDARSFMDGIALGQVTPGPIVITATFVGYLTHGLSGAVLATLAIFTPSFLILVITAGFFDRLKRSPIFTGAIQGVLASFVGLLLYVTIKFTMAVPWDPLHALMMLASLIALLLKIELLYIVPVGAVLSLLLF
jgi:chromate transporter